MNRAETVAYVQAQSACALAEIEAMKAENSYRASCGNNIAYGEDAFLAVIEKYGIHHNAVMKLFQDAAYYGG